MQVKIKRIDKGLPLPRYETEGAVGFDLLCRKDAVVAPKEITRIPANVVVEIPTGFVLFIISRSSTPFKKGLMMPNSVGVIDHDYFGDEDELSVQVYNFTDRSVEVKRGERLAQGVFLRVEKAEWQEVDKMGNSSRGGFGSTG